ncbi:Mini-ribonuclease 3 [Iocasia frigidifontis]|uniref:Mini-ribonuclease 3 n=2 Tax=Iocasia fonsfrigidae TaxID=2682810 RepID=A0A8A7KDI0_9FIRM|nr:Mini-ribonuclease 3 [Iocasia fonsfrigidae]
MGEGLKIMEEQEARLLSPGLLAYIGDSIYEVMARDYLLKKGYRSLNELHQYTVKIVNASAQAKALRKLEASLSKKELSIVRRGRNYKGGNIPANSSVIDYRMSTGLEALFGYHYLSGNYERLDFIWEKIVEVLFEE